MLSLTLCLAPPAAAQEMHLEQILEIHITRYPSMQVEDLYKLLHQAAMGSEHAVADSEVARQWLSKEIETLGDSTDTAGDEPLIEPLSPDGRLVRVNLRPYLRAALDLEGLLEAFLQTAATTPGDPRILESYCDRAVELARRGALPFDPADLAVRLDDLREQGYPAIRHSRPYAEAYRPAYRVVLRALLPGD